MRMLFVLAVLALGCGTAGPTGGVDGGSEAALREVPPGADAVCGVFVGIEPDCGMPCGTCRSCYRAPLRDGGVGVRCMFLCPPPWAISYNQLTDVQTCCRRNPVTGLEECFTP